MQARRGVHTVYAESGQRVIDQQEAESKMVWSYVEIGCYAVVL
jgi:hypothetical protein